MPSMDQQILSELSDKELLDEANKMKSTNKMNALLIGLMAGIIIYSVAKSSVSIFTFVPLFFIYKIVQDSKKKSNLEVILKERNLKVTDRK